jgi:hypothetical protein
LPPKDITMAPVETGYYDLVRLQSLAKLLCSYLTIHPKLGVPTDVNDTDLKKAYRKQAIKVIPAVSLALTQADNRSPLLGYM